MYLNPLPFFLNNSALQALHVNIDPIPRRIIQDFGLPILHDVSASLWGF